MLCGAKGDLRDAALWEQDVVVITAGMIHLNTRLFSYLYLKTSVCRAAAVEEMIHT